MLKLEELEKGKVYIAEFSKIKDFNSLFRFDKIDKKSDNQPALFGRLYLYRNEFNPINNGSWATNSYDISFKLPTKEEIYWFECCEKAQKFISKEEALKTFNTIPEYVECIKEYGKSKPGQIFSTKDEEISEKNHGLSWEEILIECNRLGSIFQPSTEAAYLAQFNKQEENEFNVGDWVVCIALNKISRVLKLDKCYKVSETLKSYSSTKSQVIRVEKTDYLHLSSNFRHAKLEEIPTEQLSDEEILELAKKFYPPSSVVYPIYGDKKQNRKIIGSYYKIGYANSNNSKTIITDYKDDDGKFEDIAIWSNKNGWAKIVSKPSVAELIKPHQEAITNSWNTINSNFNQECIIYDGGNGVFQWEIDTINYGQLESDTIIIKNRNKSVDLQITKRPKIQFQQENLIKL